MFSESDCGCHQREMETDNRECSQAKAASIWETASGDTRSHTEGSHTTIERAGTGQYCMSPCLGKEMGWRGVLVNPVWTDSGPGARTDGEVGRETQSPHIGSARDEKSCSATVDRRDSERLLLCPRFQLRNRFQSSPLPAAANKHSVPEYARYLIPRGQSARGMEPAAPLQMQIYKPFVAKIADRSFRRGTFRSSETKTEKVAATFAS